MHGPGRGPGRLLSGIPAHRRHRVRCVAQGLVARIQQHDGLELAFVHARSPQRGTWSRPSARRPGPRRRANADPGGRGGPSRLLRDYGTGILGVADYLPMSVSALADDSCWRPWSRRRPRPGTGSGCPGAPCSAWTAWRSRRRLVRGHGHLREAPGSLDFRAARRVATSDARTVVFDGTVAEVARLLPRNVNAMVALALPPSDRATAGPRSWPTRASSTACSRWSPSVPTAPGCTSAASSRWSGSPAPRCSLGVAVLRRAGPSRRSPSASPERSQRSRGGERRRALVTVRTTPRNHANRPTVRRICRYSNPNVGLSDGSKQAASRGRGSAPASCSTASSASRSPHRPR